MTSVFMSTHSGLEMPFGKWSHRNSCTCSTICTRTCTAAAITLDRSHTHLEALPRSLWGRCAMAARAPGRGQKEPGGGRGRHGR